MPPGSHHRRLGIKKRESRYLLSVLTIGGSGTAHLSRTDNAETSREDMIYTNARRSRAEAWI